MPAMAMLWEEMAVDIEAGIQATLADPTEAAFWRGQATGMADALASQDRGRVLGIQWTSLRTLAEDGIEARVARGELGPHAAASPRETVRLFGELLAQLTARVP